MKSRYFGPLTCGVLVSVLVVSTSDAEVEYDGSINSSGFVPGPNYIIDSSFGQQSGRNLFHSFRNFNIGMGENAKFVGSSDISNIFARVTSGNSSVINGLVASDIDGASLWVINPKGIIFGQGAALDISGSFYATTANSLRFEDGYFDSVPGDSVALPSGAPLRIEMLNNTLASIHINNSNLQNEQGNGIHFISNNVSLLNTQLDADQITLGSAGHIEDISIEYSGEQDAISRLTMIDSSMVSHSNLQMNSVHIVLDSVHINAGGNLKTISESLTIRNSEFLVENAVDNIDLSSTSTSFENVVLESINPRGDANIEIHSDVVSLSETSLRSYASQDVKGSDINIAARVIMLSGGELTTESDGSGVSGDISLDAKQELHINGTELRTRGVGLKGGYIHISAEGQLNLQEEAFITEYPQTSSQQVTRIQIGNATEEVNHALDAAIEPEANPQIANNQTPGNEEGREGIPETGRDQLLYAETPVVESKSMENIIGCRADGVVNTIGNNRLNNNVSTWRYPMGRYVSFSTFQGESKSERGCR